MKTRKTKKIMALLLTFLLMVASVPLLAFGDWNKANPNESTGTISVKVAADPRADTDSFWAYKLVDSTYDASSNTVNDEWNSNFTGMFTDDTYGYEGLTVDNFKKNYQDTGALRDFLAAAKKYIETEIDTKEDVDRYTADNSGDESGNLDVAVFKDLKMGSYIIVPNDIHSGVMYQYMLGSIEASVNAAGNWQIDSPTLEAKYTSKITVQAQFDKESVSNGKDVTFKTQTVGINNIDGIGDLKWKMFMAGEFEVKDTASDSKSIKVTVKNKDGSGSKDLEYRTDYTVIEKSDSSGSDSAKKTYTVTIGKEKAQAYSDKVIVVEATRTLRILATDANVGGYVGSELEARVFFSNSAHQNIIGDYDTVKTNGIELGCFEGGSSQIKGVAEFELYEKNGESYTKITDAFGLNGGKIQTTDSNFAKLSLLGSDRQYALRMIKAPSGYNMIDGYIEVDTTADPPEENNGYWRVNIGLTKSIDLPLTGGMGTTIFTITGIALMVAAGVLFVVSKKRESDVK